MHSLRPVAWRRATSKGRGAAMPGSSFILHTRAGRKISELPFGASQSPIYFCSLPALATGVTDHAGEREAGSSQHCMTTFRSRRLLGLSAEQFSQTVGRKRSVEG